MSSIKTFADLGVDPKILPALTDLGYETPSPVQEQSIPILLQNKDLFAQAQTGTGKTAAFALPILTKLSVQDKSPQAIILTPTRELALQVAETFRSYAKYMTGFHVLPIYGGQDYSGQLKGLKRGVHVVVGTPGRVMDHLRRKTLVLANIKTIVLDEADEMLKMGFFDDVTWVLDQLPASHQTALFSATIPDAIKKIANKYLKEPCEVRINPKAKTVAAIKQYYMLISDNHKLEALTRFLEVENFDAILIFTRTKNATTELAEKLEARGYAVAAMNGDMKQSLRERVIAGVKRKALDIIVATDVAARGLDIDRISHVISYDVPYDAGSYIHRIGRTGRAGREGKALLFITPREQRMLKDIERMMNQAIPVLNPPSTKDIKTKRVETFMEKVLQALAKDSLDYHRGLVAETIEKSGRSALDVAVALASLVHKEKPVQEIPIKTVFEPHERKGKNRRELKRRFHHHRGNKPKSKSFSR